MRRIFIVAIILHLILSITISSNASSTQDYQSKIYSDIDKIKIPDEINDVDINLSTSANGININDIFRHIGETIKSNFKSPLNVLITVILMSMISSIICSLTDRSEIYETVIVIACFVSVSSQIIKSLTIVISAIKSIQAFMISYIPIYTSVIISSGNPTAAISYNSILLYICEGITLFATAFLKPIVMCVCVFSVVQSINTANFDIVAMLKKAFTSMIGFAMAIFTGAIGLNAALGNVSNGIGLRAGKYIISSFIPVLGYAINQSYDVIKSSLASIRTTIGAFGIIIIFLTISVPIISLSIYRLFFTISEWIASLFQSNRIAKLMKGLNEVYSLILTLLIMYLLMLVISTGILISLGGHVR